MDQRVFHGNITPSDIAQGLMAEFNQGNLRTQIVGESDNLTVQIATAQMARSGGRTATTVNIRKVEDGVLVQIGQQEWLGVAASLGTTVISALLNPMNLLGRLDDIAQDVTNLQLTEKIWLVITNVARAHNAGQEISEHLSRLTCEFCGAANPVGEPSCVACGAPLGKVQPKACSNCGYVLEHNEKFCPNCGKQI